MGDRLTTASASPSTGSGSPRGIGEVLALHGGEPVVAPGVIEERWPRVSDADVESVVEVLRSGRLSWIDNEAVPALEARWAQRTGTEHCIALNSGTAALHAAVAAAGVEPGDEVLVPALSFLASATAVVHHQGLPVFVDVDPDTFTIDPSKIEERIGPRTRAIIAVHLHGLPADMDPIVEIAERHGLKVIEDAAQAPGATYRGRPVGALGHMAAFSIMAGKNLPTAGEGGLFTTDDVELRDRADRVKMFGERIVAGEEREYNALTLGWNYRFSSLLAAFTLTQLDRLDEHTEWVRTGAERLADGLATLPGLIPPRVPDDRTHVYHHFRFKLDPEAAGVDLSPGRFRRIFQEAMVAEGVPLIEYQNRPLPGQVMFQQMAGYGRGCPWRCGHTDREVVYDPMEYPATLEIIRSSLLVGKRLCMASFMEPENIELYRTAFDKVHRHRSALEEHGRALDYAEPWEQEPRLW